MSPYDFCSPPGPAWRYPAVTFTDSFGSRSVESWLVSGDGHRLIAAGDRTAPARRSLSAPWRFVTAETCTTASGKRGGTRRFQSRRDG